MGFVKSLLVLVMYLIFFVENKCKFYFWGKIFVILIFCCGNVFVVIFLFLCFFVWCDEFVLVFFGVIMFIDFVE